MQVTFYETNEEEKAVVLELLAPHKDKLKINPIFVFDKLDANTASYAKDSELISVFVYSEIKPEILTLLPKLKFVTTRSTGFDHIDVKTCASKGIEVCYVPAYGSRTVAEFAFALMLGLSRKTFRAYHQVKEKHDFDFTNFKGFNLAGKTLGIVGTGRIGLNVAQIAKGFNMNMVAYDPFPNLDKAKELGFEYMELNQVLNKADVVTLHVPYNDKTHHLINKQNITQFKKGALLINTARGEVVETEAILQGIKDGILAGVGLDVLEGERAFKEEWIRLTTNDEKQKLHEQEIKTMLETHMLIEMPEVAITPHIAFFTDEAKREILQTTIDNIVGFIQNQPKNQIHLN